MVSVILIGIWLVILAYNIYKWTTFRPKNFPQGPPRLPIVGTYPLLLLINYKHIYKALDWLCQIYKTDILGFYATTLPTILANTSESVREVLNNKLLDGKPNLEIMRLRDPEFVIRGIFFTEGTLWHEQRRFALRYLRDFGFGRRHGELELELQNDTLEMIDCIKNGPMFEHEKKYHDGESVLIPDLLTMIYGSHFYKVLLNDRMPREKKHILLEAGLHAHFFNQNGDAWGRLFSYWNLIPKLFPEISGHRAMRDSAMKYYSCMKAILDEQYKTFDPQHERHFLDLYFKKMDESKNDPASTFSYEQLIIMIADFFLPSFTTTTSQTQFLFQRFYLQPEILEKCQNEIDQVVGHDRLPTLNDRVHLPFFEATLRESLRHETLLPNGLPHFAKSDTIVMGYDIPKNGIVMASLHAANRDEKTFNEAHLFKPERFLDENGMFSPKLDKSLPFGAGKRLCAGETFARNTMFLAVSALVQQFDISVGKNSRMPMPEESCTGIFRYLPDYRLKFSPRNFQKIK